MTINTGFTTFDEQTKFLGIGNVTGNTQLGSYITKANFIDDIKKFDLQYDHRNLLEKFLDDVGGKCVLYKFFFKKRNELETIGFFASSKKSTMVFGARTEKRAVALNKIVEVIKLKESL